MMKKNKALPAGRQGFTFIEILVYVAIFGMVISVILSFLLWVNKTNIKTKALQETTDNARRAMEQIVFEIKEAKDIYYPTSSFESHPGQLSLVTAKYLPTGETLSFVDFFLCGSQLCMKKESQPPVALTSERVQVSNLVFNLISTDSATSSVQINLSLNYITQTDKPEYQASTTLISAASLRGK